MSTRRLAAAPSGGISRPVQPSETELVARARQGDQDAQETLFRAHYSRVYRTLFALMPNDAELEDMVQDVFMRALHTIRSLEDTGALGAWLRMIAVHVARNRIRKRKLLSRLGLRSHADLQPVLDAVVSSAAPPDLAAELMAVYRIVNRLPSDSRIALVLSRVEGLSLEEVAAQMNLSVSTVKRRLATAEVELRDELAKRGPR